MTVIRRPAWLPYGGFLGTPDSWRARCHGQVIEADPQATWILVPGRPRSRTPTATSRSSPDRGLASGTATASLSLCA